MKGGGHGQSNINFLEENGIEYNIVKEYDNGVRVGNVPKHKTPQKEQEQDKHGFLNIGQIVRLKRQEIMLLIYRIIRTCQMVLLDMENMME